MTNKVAPAKQPKRSQSDLPTVQQLDHILAKGGLVLSRKFNEAIVLRNDIAIQIAEIRGDMVRLRICAPSDVAIWRDEVIRRQNDSA